MLTSNTNSVPLKSKPLLSISNNKVRLKVSVIFSLGLMKLHVYSYFRSKIWSSRCDVNCPSVCRDTIDVEVGEKKQGDTVTLIEIQVHLIWGISGHMCTFYEPVAGLNEWKIGLFFV